MKSLKNIFMLIVVVATFGAYYMPGGLATRPGKSTAKDVADGYASLLAPQTAMDKADPQGDPKDPYSYLRYEKPNGLSATGHTSYGPILSLEGGAPAFITDVFDGYRSLAKADQPAQILGYQVPPKCALSPHNPEHYVAHVKVYRNKNFSGFYPQQQSMRSAPFIGGFGTGSKMIAEGFRAIDVAITHTDAPVHLVLSSGANFALWNFHLAQGVTIARVTNIGGGVDAFANLPEGVRIERAMEGRDGDCHPEQKYPWAKDPYQGKPFPGFDEYDQQVKRKEYLAKQDRYATWFRTHFGISPFERLAGWDNAQAVLVGPMPAPDAKVRYQPLPSSTLRMPQDRTLYAGRTRASKKLYEAAMN